MDVDKKKVQLPTIFCDV